MLQKDVGVGGRVLAVVLSAPVALALVAVMLAMTTWAWGSGFAALWLAGLLLVSMLSGWAIADLRTPGRSRLHWVAVGVVAPAGGAALGPGARGHHAHRQVELRLDGAGWRHRWKHYRGADTKAAREEQPAGGCADPVDAGAGEETVTPPA